MRKKPKKNKMGSIDYGIFYCVIILVCIGIVMVYSASSYWAMFRYEDSMYFLKKQIMIAPIGVFAMYFMMCFDYHKIKQYTVPLMIGSIPLLLAVFFFEGANGAQRWIRIGSLSFQPSDLAKYVVVIFIAMSLERKGEDIKDFKKGIVPYLMISGFYAAIVLAEKNLSIACVIMIVTFIMLFAAGGRVKHLFGYVAPALVAAAIAFTVLEPYRMKRLMNFTNPWKDPTGDGYQLIQSFYALGAGGITGLGLGQSRQKTLYIPEPHNDFILSVIGEELGLIGCFIIIALFVILFWRGIVVAMKAKDVYGSLLAVGITSVIAVQSLINIAVVTGSMPVTGVPLPFISYGGTSLVINLTAMGILLNVSRQIEERKSLTK